MPQRLLVIGIILDVEVPSGGLFEPRKSHNLRRNIVALVITGLEQ
jgi:hypothetical protein